MASITFNQTGIPAGVAGRARSDGLADGSLVTITTSSAGQVELLFVPPRADYIEVVDSLTQVNSTTWTFEPQANVYGSYRVKFTSAIDPTDFTTLVFSVRTPNRGLRIPALNERANPSATLATGGSALSALSEFNEPFGDPGMPLSTDVGNYGGWYTSMVELIEAVDGVAEDIPVVDADNNGLMTPAMLAKLNELEIQADAADAINAIQEAAIAANEAADAANAALDTLQGNDIVKLTQRSVFKAGVYVEDHTPGGAALTTVNFEAALLAAIAAARLLCDAPENSDANIGSVPVYVPAGNWPMSEGFAIHNTWPKFAPSLIGLGVPGSCILRFNHLANFPGIMIGCNPDGTIAGTACRGVVIQNIDIYVTGGASRKGGIKGRNTFHCTLRDIFIRGAGMATGGPWHERAGIDFRNNNYGETAIPDLNHQHLYIERVQVYYSLIGFWFGDGLWSATVIDGNANGCVYPAVYEGAVVGWFGGNCQGGDADSSRHSSGMMHSAGLPGGASASVTAASGGYSTVSGLTSMLGFAGDGAHLTYKGSFISIGLDIFRIHEVLGAGSCTIRRSTGGALSGQAWQVHGCRGGNEVTLTGEIYHETDTGRHYLETGADFLTSSFWDVSSVQAKVHDAVVASTGCTGSLRVHSVRGGGSAKIARINQCTSFVTDSSISDIDTDGFSRSGIIARYPVGVGGVRNAVWDARPRSARYNSALLERGAVVFDARKLSSFVRSGLDITTWADVEGLSTFANIVPGNFSLLVEMDPVLGAPAVQVSNAPALHKGMSCNIGGRFSAGRHHPTLIVIARIPVAEQVAGGRRIALDGTDLQTYIGFDDTGHSSSRDLYGFYYTYPDFGFTTADLVDTDTNAHWLYTTAMMSGGNSGGSGSEQRYLAGIVNHGNVRRGVDLPGTLTLSLFPDLGGTGSLLVSHVAVLPDGITTAERDHFRDLALGEFNIESGGW